MAKTTAGLSVEERARQLQGDLAKTIAAAGWDSTSTAGANITWNHASPAVTKEMMDDYAAEARAKRLQAEQEEAIRRKWLDETQSMRVVALNEATSMAKAYLGQGINIDTAEILQAAERFACFLVEGKR